jgi:hypothetical protein
MSFRSWCYRRGIRWHAQNLTRDSGGPKRAMWHAGRAWITFFRPASVERDEDGDLFTINPEWHVRLQRDAGVSLTVGDGDSDGEVGLSASGPLGSVYLTIEPRSRRWAKRLERYLPGYWFDRTTYSTVDGPGSNRMKHTEPAEISLRWHDGALWWSAWHSTHSWSSKTPRWRHGSFDLVDFLLGRREHSKVTVGEPVRAVASFPEGDYPLLLQRETRTWKRARWPGALVRHAVDIRAGSEAGGEAPGFRGKGENSYDLDDDAILGMSSEGHSFEDAIGKYVAATLRNRRKYGHIAPEHRAVEEVRP